MNEISDAELMSFILWTCVAYVFAIVCLILLIRLLMAMMTNTFRSVQSKAQLEWRLLIARHVLRLELFVLTFAGKSVFSKMLAGSKSAVDGKYYHHFLHVAAPPGEPKSVPMLLAMSGANELFNEDTEEATQDYPATAEGSLMRRLELGEDILSSVDAASSRESPSEGGGEEAGVNSSPDGSRAGSPMSASPPAVQRRAGSPGGSPAVRRAGSQGGESRGSSPERAFESGALPAAHPLAALAREMSPEGIELVANFMRAIVANPSGGNRKLVAAKEEASRAMTVYEA